MGDHLGILHVVDLLHVIVCVFVSSFAFNENIRDFVIVISIKSAISNQSSLRPYHCENTGSRAITEIKSS